MAYMGQDLAQKPPASVLTQETANEDTQFERQFKGGSVLSASRDQILESELHGEYRGYDYLLTDNRISANLDIRKMALITTPYKICVDSEDPAEVERIEEMCEEQLGVLACLPQTLHAMMDSIVLGFKVCELVWGPYGDGYYIKEIIVKDNDNFAFDLNWKLMFRPSINMTFTPVAYEPYKFYVMTRSPINQNRYGVGIGASLYFLTVMKRECLKAWALCNDRFAEPWPVAKTPAAYPEQLKQELLGKLKRLRRLSALVLDDEVTLELLESQRTSNGQSFQMFADYADEQIAQRILGSTLTTGEGRSGSGSYAKAKVHMQVQDFITSGDAIYLQEFMQTILRYCVAMNLGEEAAYKVRFEYDFTPRLSVMERASLLKDLSQAVRAPISKKSVFEEFGLDEPEDETDVLMLGGQAQGPASPFGPAARFAITDESIPHWLGSYAESLATKSGHRMDGLAQQMERHLKKKPEKRG